MEPFTAWFLAQLHAFPPRMRPLAMGAAGQRKRNALASERVSAALGLLRRLF